MLILGALIVLMESSYVQFNFPSSSQAAIVTAIFELLK